MSPALMESLRESVTVRKYSGDPLTPNIAKAYAERAMRDAELLINMPERDGEELDNAEIERHLRFAADMFLSRVKGTSR